MTEAQQTPYSQVTRDPILSVDLSDLLLGTPGLKGS